MNEPLDPRADRLTRQRPSNAWCAVVFVLVALAIAFASRAMIGQVNHEIGDFAANSLLIQDAKALSLLKGNYSRIGVNHPGPAILDVLAFGEWLFHDVLHLAKSPFSGQLIAVAFYSAFWIVLLGRSFRRVTRPAPAVLCTAAFLLVASILDHRVLDGAWFPDLYFFPFAVMLVSIARLANGTCEGLLSLALSAGFLVNGHVSFIASLAIVLAVVVVANYVRFRNGPAERRIVGKAFFVAHRRRLIVATAVFASFFVPLVIETVLHFPGPVAGYIQFGGSQVTHRTREALDFVASYWGGVVPAIAALATLWLLTRVAHARSATNDALVSGAIAILAASVAVFVYAKYGVDLLEYKYVAFFYFAAPAFAVALVVVAIWDATPKPLGNVAAYGLAALCAWGVYVNARKTPLYADQYDAPSAVTLYDAMKAKAAGGRLVLDLDSGFEWGYLWTHLVGAEAYAKRRQVPLFCVAKNWHPLFTDAARCSTDELQSDRRYLVRSMTAPNQQPERLVFQAAELGFYRYDAPVIANRGYLSVHVDRRPFDEYFLESGWSPSNDDFAWTTDKESHLSLRVGPGFAGSVRLDLDAFVPAPKSTQDVTFFVDGARIGEYQWSATQRRRTIELPVAPSKSGVVDVKLMIRKPLVPARFGGVNTDSRTLGLSLYGLQVESR